MPVRIEPSWKRALAAEFDEPWFAALAESVRKAYLSEKVFPPPKDVFRAFDECPFDQVKVVILGQDPYHGDGQADGLCFSVRPPEPMPPSLKNIIKEMRADVGGEAPKDGDLSHLARQGVLLLNAVLTVRAHSPASHRAFGWERFTDAVIRSLSDRRERLVFILWGAFARSKAPLIDAKKHLILQSAHPSPLSAHAGFFGNGHFSKTNAYLSTNGVDPIVWLQKDAAME